MRVHLRPVHLVRRPLITTTDQISVSGITLRRVRIPLIEPFRISNGSVAEKDVIVVEVNTGSGITGWGEASPMAGTFYSSDTPEKAWQDLEMLIPFVLGAGAVDVEIF